MPLLADDGDERDEARTRSAVRLHGDFPLLIQSEPNRKLRRIWVKCFYSSPDRKLRGKIVLYLRIYGGSSFYATHIERRRRECERHGGTFSIRSHDRTYDQKCKLLGLILRDGGFAHRARGGEWSQARRDGSKFGMPCRTTSWKAKIRHFCTYSERDDFLARNSKPAARGQECNGPMLHENVAICCVRLSDGLNSRGL